MPDDFNEEIQNFTFPLNEKTPQLDSVFRPTLFVNFKKLANIVADQ